MKHLLLLTLIILISSKVNAQVLSATIKNCKHQAVSSRVQDRIISIEMKGDTCHYVLGKVLPNCNIDSTFTIFYDWFNPDSLDIKVDLQNQYTSCNCYFEIILDVIKKNANVPVISYDRTFLFELSPHFYKIQPEKYMIYKGDTINFSDIYGFKQGKHIFFDQENNLPSHMIFYSNDIVVWDANYSKNENLILINFYKVDPFSGLNC